MAFESPSTRIPLEMLGAGIQQVVVLIARLLISDATLIAIEEPELNLRYTLQLRFGEILNDIVKDKVGPQQLFLTSHSPAFEFGEYFYAMKTNRNGPTVKRYPIENVDIFTQHWQRSHPVGKTAPLCYVSGDGMVQLPERIRQLLSIEQGGGIFLLKRKDNEHVELLTDDQYLDLFEPIEDE
jgi:hypothetical protein